MQKHNKPKEIMAYLPFARDQQLGGLALPIEVVAQRCLEQAYMQGRIDQYHAGLGHLVLKEAFDSLLAVLNKMAELVGLATMPGSNPRVLPTWIRQRELHAEIADNQVRFQNLLRDVRPDLITYPETVQIIGITQNVARYLQRLEQASGSDIERIANDLLAATNEQTLDNLRGIAQKVRQEIDLGGRRIQSTNPLHEAIWTYGHTFYLQYKDHSDKWSRITDAIWNKIVETPRAQRSETEKQIYAAWKNPRDGKKILQRQKCKNVVREAFEPTNRP